MSHALETINRYAGRPVYRQLCDLLEARLATTANPGDRLPSEAELSEEFDVNRLTLRRALEELNQRGLIETVRGKGSFVAPPRVRYDVSAGRDASFTRSMRQLGHRVGIRLLATETTDKPELGTELQAAGAVLVFDTLRLVDDEPWSLSKTTVDAERFPRLADHWTGESSLFDYLLEFHGVRMRRSYRTFAAAQAEPAEAEYLQLRPGAPVLEMRGLNIDDAGSPVTVVQHRFRSDRVQFTVQMA